MRPFSKQEILAVSIIFLVIVGISLRNFGIAKRLGRDAQRKSDVGSITNGLNKYNDDFGVYPQASDDGKIIACRGEEIEQLVEDQPVNSFSLAPCEWGKDALEDVNDPNFPPYIKTLPTDPKSREGFSYTYLSNGKRFQIFAALEGRGEAEYDPVIEARGIICGAGVCNFGRSSGKTPLDKSIQEYENELLEESK